MVDFPILHVELKATRRSGIGLYRARHREGCLVREGPTLGKQGLSDVLRAHHRLHNPGAVPYLQEVDLALGAPVVEPTGNGHGLTHMAPQAANFDFWIELGLDHAPHCKGVWEPRILLKALRPLPAVEAVPRRHGSTAGR